MYATGFRRYFFLTLGFIALGAGIAGFILPLIPGTPFLIVAAYCFSQSSKRFHDWLIHHKYLGPPIRAWDQRGAISLRAKVLATIAIVASAVLILPREQIPMAGKIAYAAFLLVGLGFIWTRPR